MQFLHDLLDLDETASAPARPTPLRMDTSTPIVRSVASIVPLLPATVLDRGFLRRFPAFPPPSPPQHIQGTETGGPKTAKAKGWTPAKVKTKEEFLDEALHAAWGLHTGTLSKTDTQLFRETVAWAEWSRAGKVGHWRKEGRGKGKKDKPTVAWFCLTSFFCFEVLP